MRLLAAWLLLAPALVRAAAPDPDPLRELTELAFPLLQDDRPADAPRTPEPQAAPVAARSAASAWTFAAAQEAFARADYAARGLIWDRVRKDWLVIGYASDSPDPACAGGEVFAGGLRHSGRLGRIPSYSLVLFGPLVMHGAAQFGALCENAVLDRAQFQLPRAFHRTSPFYADGVLREEGFPVGAKLECRAIDPQAMICRVEELRGGRLVHYFLLAEPR